MGLVLLSGLAAFLVPVGLQNLALFRDLGLANMNSSTADYGALSRQYINSYQSLTAVVILINFVPVLIGVLFAVPIVLEFEQRTYRLAWTQSVTRGHWLATKLGLALIAVIAFSTVLTVLTSWFLSPADRLVFGPFRDFSVSGIVPVAYAVFAFAVALAVGALSRRTALTVILALVVCVVAVVGVGSGLRPHYMTPVEQCITEVKMLGRAWVLDVYAVDASGNRLGDVQMSGTSTNEHAAAGMREVAKYQPADRYWPFQGIEASIFFGMSAMLLGTTVGVVKRRMR